MFRRSKRPTTRRIEIYLENLEQFFNSMDPSPFHEKDLDDDAEEFIISWAEEFQVYDPIVLVIHLSRYPTNIDPQQVVEKAVHNHFAYKVRLNRLQFKRLLREGRISLLIGSLFLGTCPSHKPLIAVCGDKRARRGGTREFNDRRLGGDVAPDGNISLRMVAASSLEENV